MKTYLNVPYAKKDTAKRLGARWDGIRKQWYVQDVENIAAFTRWIDKRLLKPTRQRFSSGTSHKRTHA